MIIVGKSTYSRTTNHMNHWRSSLLNGINFLHRHQSNYGEFETVLSSESSMTKTKPCLASSPYLTSFVLHSISFIREDEKVLRMTEKSLDFLLSAMEEHSTWRFYPANNRKVIYADGAFRKFDMRIVPDFDDTACASYALRTNKVSFPSNEELFYNAKMPGGAFPTWVLDKQELIKEKDYVPPHNNICCGVNANVLMYLGDNSRTKDVSSYINQVILHGKEAESCDYFPNPLALYYLISRAYFTGASSLSESQSAITEKLLCYLHSEQHSLDVLSIALAVASLLNFNCFTHDLDKWIDIIIDRQQADGSWPAKSFFIDSPGGNYYGSRELTTAIAIEVISRASLLVDR
jgi:hypothetical protein